jgi:hypothetical protein
MILPAVLCAAGAVGAALFLTGQGLDRAEKWASIVGIVISVATGATGLLLGWLAWRHPRPGPSVVGPVKAVDARRAQGVQIGDDNTQHNTFS